MRHIKKYEGFEKYPKVDDYVVVKFDLETKMNKILETMIGTIIDKQGEHFLVKYGTTRWIIKHDSIIAFSENKEDLEPYIQAKKYNL